MARESTIRVLRSTGSTDPTGLTFGELAYTDANGKLFMGTTAGASLWIGTGITTGGIATNSATLVPTQSAVKSYVDGVVGGGSVVNSFNGTGGAITLTGSGAILYTQSGITNTISARLATTGVTGVASFNSSDFDVSAGADVTIKTGGVGNTQLANSSVTVSAGSGLAGGGAVSLGGSVTLTNAGVTGVVAGTGITISGGTGNVIITNNGVQSVNSLTGAVTGIATTAGKLSQFASTTSAELFGVISNPSGSSGSLVFSTGPTFTSSINTSSASFNLFNANATTLSIGSDATTGRLFGYTGVLAATQSVTVAGANTGVGVNKTVNIGTGSGTNGGVTVNIGQTPSEGSGTINLLSKTVVTESLRVPILYASNVVNSWNGLTGAVTFAVPLASASVTGVASFGNEFVVSGVGAVGLTSNYVKSVNGLTGAIVSVAVTGSNTFTGLQTMNAGITSNNLWVTNGVTFASSSYHTGLATFAGGLSAAGGATFSGNISAPNIVNSFNGTGGAITLTGSGAILYSQSGGTNTISARLAGTGVTGVASFNTASFAVSAGADVTIKSGGVSNAQLANSSVTVNAGGTSTLNLADTLTLTSGSNITLSNTANTVTLGLANDIVIAGNLTVNGTVVTANVDSFIAEDSMFALGTGNAADSLDIGFYGIYTNASQRSFTGLFRDASDGGKYKMYTGLTGAEPTTTVNTAAAGYAVATLVVNIDGGTF